MVFTSKVVYTKETFLKSLDEFLPDLILSDYDLPTFDGLAALRIAQEKCPDVPFILVTGKLGEEFVIDKLKDGATDYVLKGNLKRLVPVINRALEEAKLIAKGKQAEEALRKEHELSQNILNTAQAIILVLDTNGYIVNFNPYMEEISGYRIDEVRGKDWFSTFIPKETQDRTRTFFKKAISDIKTKGNIDSIITKDGRKLYIEWYDTTLKGEDGKIIGLLSIGQDITERKEAEEALQKSEERFRDLYDNAPDMYHTLDKNGIIVDCNITKANMLGYKKEEIIGRHVTDFFTEKSKILFESDFPRLEQEKSLQDIEREFIRKDGTIFTASLNVFSEYDENGRLKGTKTISHDITERKRAEKEIQERVKELEDFYAVAIDRELRMIELKEKIEELETKLKKYENL